MSEDNDGFEPQMLQVNILHEMSDEPTQNTKMKLTSNNLANLEKPKTAKENMMNKVVKIVNK
jgi:hypothetical protein